MTSVASNLRPAPDRVLTDIAAYVARFEKNVARVYAEKQRRAILDVCLDRGRLCAMPVNEFFDIMERISGWGGARRGHA